MRRADIPIGPPVWTQGTKARGTTILKGEVGVLRYIHLTAQQSQKCYLVIEHNGQHYVGGLLLDDSAFCSQICALLQQNIGRSIKEIGELEVSFTPK
jgi:hypothetical protein